MIDYIPSLAEEILEAVDYDIFKEDLEERGILSQIEGILRIHQSMMKQKEITLCITSIALKSESGDNYLFVSQESTKAGVLDELSKEWYVTETLYIESLCSTLDISRQDVCTLLESLQED